jgi:hypothetical protein
MKNKHVFTLDSSYRLKEFGPTRISLRYDYLWVGSDKTCWGHLWSLRDLRKMHARLGTIIQERSK